MWKAFLWLIDRLSGREIEEARQHEATVRLEASGLEQALDDALEILAQHGRSNTSLGMRTVDLQETVKRLSVVAGIGGNGPEAATRAVEFKTLVIDELIEVTARVN